MSIAQKITIVSCNIDKLIYKYNDGDKQYDAMLHELKICTDSIIYLLNMFKHDWSEQTINNRPMYKIANYHSCIDCDNGMICNIRHRNMWTIHIA
jgi:hypothetical protein